MSDPIHSSGWTGEIEQPTYARGQSSVSDLYQRLRRAQKELDELGREVPAVRRLALCLLFAPLTLWLAHQFVRIAIPDQLATTPSGPIAAWTCVAIIVAAWQVRSRSRRFATARRIGLTFLIAATIGGAFLYARLAMRSYATAIPSARERAFEFYRCKNRCRFGGYYLHQRADGSTIEGEYLGPPVNGGTRCTIVQLLHGRYGFKWVRVMERSPASRGELQWQIRREDCFSEKPLQLLVG